MQTAHQGYKQGVDFVGSALNGTGVWLAVCVRTWHIDRYLIELCRDTI